MHVRVLIGGLAEAFAAVDGRPRARRPLQFGDVRFAVHFLGQPAPRLAPLLHRVRPDVGGVQRRVAHRDRSVDQDHRDARLFDVI